MIFPEILYARTNAKDLVTQQNEIIVRNTITTYTAASNTQPGYSPPPDRIFILTAGTGRVAPFDILTSVNSVDLEYVLNGQVYTLPSISSPPSAIAGQIRVAAFTGEVWFPGGGQFQLRSTQSAATLAGVIFAVYGVTIPRGNTTVG